MRGRGNSTEGVRRQTKSSRSSAEAKAAVIELSTICKRSMIAQLNTIEIKRKQIKTQLLKPIPNQTCHCHVVTGARLSRPQCQTKCQTSLVTETMLEDAACLCTNTSYVCSVRVRSAPGGQTLHQGHSLSRKRDAAARQNLFVC